MRLTPGTRPPTPWGKLSPRGEPTDYHPLIDHCVDVAAVTEQLLCRTLLGARLAALAGRPDLDPVTIARLAVIAGLHDIGKANHGFQNKAVPGCLTAGHVGEGLSLLEQARQDPAIHGPLGQPHLSAWTGQPREMFGLLKAAICHHGRFTAPRTYRAPDWLPNAHHRPLDTLTDLWRALLHAFPDALATGASPLPEAPPFVHAFAGLIMLADWIGSDTRAFPYAEEADGPRILRARPAAITVLAHLGLDASLPREALRRSPATFAAWTGLPAPRGPQAALVDQPLPAKGSVAILEAETGAGKTEAAWTWFARLHAAGAVDGLVFALPTRAAATQLHGRMVGLARQAFGEAHPAVLLAVPGYLQVDEARGQRLPAFEVLWPDTLAEEGRWRTWAAEHSKRYLAGAIAVGTVDQVLLSVLHTGHAHLRNTALLRQLLVVDEVHASDAYMTSLLEIVLKRHVEAGGHALLLSATLGSKARHRYAHLGLPPRKYPSPDLAAAIAAPYPLLTLAPWREAPRAFSLPADGARSKTIHLQPQALAEDAGAIADLAIKAARNGARVLVIRNTVKGCLAVFAAVEAIDPALLLSLSGQPCPHHSRYALEDRKQLDKALERALAPAKNRQGPRPGLIAITTQTAEQSLDIDADLLITDLCPIDVLLQRIGRLHRHDDNARPAAFAAAGVRLLLPEVADLRPYLASGRGPHGLGTVYEDLRVLQATWQLATAGTPWTIPADNRSLVERATHPAALDALAKADSAWAAHGNKVEGKQAAHGSHAKVSAISFSEDPRPFEDEEARVSTRLGAESRRLVLPNPFPGPFGSPVQTFTLPAHLAEGLPADPGPIEATQTPEGLRITVADRVYFYDRLGLR
jgi:CRISPR-associated endonuclease/helicase Cas3